MELWILFGVFSVLLLIGVPVAFCLGIASVATVAFMGLPPVVVFQQMNSGMNAFAMMAIPFFIYAGDLMIRGGIAERLIQMAASLVGHLRGGLGQVNVVTLSLIHIFGQLELDAGKIMQVGRGIEIEALQALFAKQALHLRDAGLELADRDRLDAIGFSFASSASKLDPPTPSVIVISFQASAGRRICIFDAANRHAATALLLSLIHI